MKIMLYKDSTAKIRLAEITENLLRIAPDILFMTGSAKFSLTGNVVSSPGSYQQLSDSLLQETADSVMVLLFTEKRYDNNYFWEGDGKNSIISFFGWDHLTNLSRNNGSVYFICAILVRALCKGGLHYNNTGCINDFWRDKTGVDVGMRSAFVCPMCLLEFQRNSTSAEKRLLQQIQAILNDVSIASRIDMDICDYWSLRKQDELFDVFLCHNSEDKKTMRELCTRLKQDGIKTWFDEEQLPPGRPWQDELEKQIERIKTAAVFVGKKGIGPWQQPEIRAFLQEFVKRRCPVIPVILSDCTPIPQLPLFLNQLTWVDFRKDTPDPYKQLLWGITGRKPK